MIDISKWVHYETQSGEPIQAGGVTVTPHNWVLTVRWPNGAWLWNYPLAITVNDGNLTYRQPIIDITRQAQWTMLGLAILFILKSIRN
ncbi:MAG: hypothetical protein KF893_23540 [Caldilineaceae bacterium]|nr:hypothetical protein [Caldilineaceae bacterium]